MEVAGPTPCPAAWSAILTQPGMPSQLDLATSSAHPGTTGMWMANFAHAKNAEWKRNCMSSLWIRWSSATNLAFPNRRWSEKTSGFVNFFWPNMSLIARITKSSPPLRMVCFVQPCFYASIRGLPQPDQPGREGTPLQQQPPQPVLKKFWLGRGHCTQNVEVSSATIFSTENYHWKKKGQKEKTNKQIIVAKTIGRELECIVICDGLRVWNGNVPYRDTARACSISGTPWWCRKTIAQKIVTTYIIFW